MPCQNVCFPIYIIREKVKTNADSVIVYGEKISRIQPAWYIRIFITCDIISLSLQGGGGELFVYDTSDDGLRMLAYFQLPGLPTAQ